MRTRSPIIERIIATGASAQCIARQIGVTPSALSQWDRVPPLRVLTVERVTGIPRHELRPDLYPPPDDTVAPAAPSPKPSAPSSGAAERVVEEQAA